MRTGACIRARTAIARATKAAAIATISAVATITITEAAWTARAKAAVTSTIASAAITAAVAEPTARRRWWSWAVELKLGRHRLSTILREIECHALTFTKRLQSSFCQR
jgi:hypothetical protein